MLELGKHSKKLHQSIAATLLIKLILIKFYKRSLYEIMFEKLLPSKKGRVLSNKSQIIDLIRNDLNNNDSLMVKASNATGFNKIIKEMKGVN